MVDLSYNMKKLESESEESDQKLLNNDNKDNK